jgi:hypothetical protein
MNARNAQPDLAESCGTRDRKVTAPAATLEGQALNISERGVYFTSDMDPRLPREFAGRWPEQGTLHGRVVHVDAPRPLGVCQAARNPVITCPYCAAAP